jgi:hypothetical protein
MTFAGIPIPSLRLNSLAWGLARARGFSEKQSTSEAAQSFGSEVPDSLNMRCSFYSIDHGFGVLQIPAIVAC